MKRLLLLLGLAVAFLFCTGCDELETLLGINSAPSVYITEDDTTIYTHEELTIHVVASDSDGDPLTFVWFVDGEMQNTAVDASYRFVPPGDTAATFIIEVEVSDGKTTVTESIRVTVELVPNDPPVVSIRESGVTLGYGETFVINADAYDPDGDTLEYVWRVNDVPQIGEDTATFTFSRTPEQLSVYEIVVEVTDNIAEPVSASISLVVKNLIDTNSAPDVSISEPDQTIENGESLLIHADAVDIDGDAMTFAWFVNSVLQVDETGSSFLFSATPLYEQLYIISVDVSDGIADPSTASVAVTVIGNQLIEQPPGLLALYDSWELTTIQSPPGTDTIVAFDGTLYAMTITNEFYYLDGFWKVHAAALPDNVVGSGVYNSYLYAINGDGALFYLEGNDWKTTVAPEAPGIISLGEYNDTLYGLNVDGDLLYLETAWVTEDIETPESSISLSTHDGNLLVLTRDGLYKREDTWFSIYNIGEAPPENTISFTTMEGAIPDLHYCLVVE